MKDYKTLGCKKLKRLKRLLNRIYWQDSNKVMDGITAIGFLPTIYRGYGVIINCSGPSCAEKFHLSTMRFFSRKLALEHVTKSGYLILSAARSICPECNKEMNS